MRRSLGVLAPTEVAALVGCDERTLAELAAQRAGHHYIKAGRVVPYRWVSVRARLAERKQETQW